MRLLTELFVFWDVLKKMDLVISSMWVWVPVTCKRLQKVRERGVRMRAGLGTLTSTRSAVMGNSGSGGTASFKHEPVNSCIWINTLIFRIFFKGIPLFLFFF